MKKESLVHYHQFVTDGSCGFSGEDIEKLKNSSFFEELYSRLDGRELLQTLSSVHKEVMAISNNVTVEIKPAPQKTYEKFVYRADKKQFLWIIVHKTELRMSVCLDYDTDVEGIDTGKKWFNPKKKFSASYACLGRAGTTFRSVDMDDIFEHMFIIRLAYQKRDQWRQLKSQSRDNGTSHSQNTRIRIDKSFEDASPKEFEMLCCQKLNDMGWSANLTPHSGDQGVDVKAEKSGVIIALQCKKYATNATIGNDAVQEVISGRIFYGADVAFVVTNATYTNSARELASKADIHLLHYLQLDKIEEILSQYLKNPKTIL